MHHNQDARQRPHASRATLLLRSTLVLGPCLALLAGCRPGGEAEAGSGSAPNEPGGVGALQQAEAPKVLVAPVQRREMVRRISTTTVVESEREIEVFPRISGQVVELFVEEGDRVSKDDPLVALDPREAQAALDEANIALREAEDAKTRLDLAVTEAEERAERARLTLEQSKRELERKEGVAEGLLSKNELEQLKLAVDQNESDLAAARTATEKARAERSSQDIAIDRANLQVERAELDLSYTRIVASFDGVIAARTVKVGDQVSSGAALFTLTDPDSVRAIVFRPQRELAFFRAARASSAESEERVDIVAHPEALPGESYTGHIQIVSPTIQADSGQFGVTIGLEQPTDDRPPLLPGMLLRVEIVTERHPNALVVPKRAVVREGEAYFVCVLDEEDESIVRRVRVDEGFTDDRLLEITPHVDGSLEEGRSVVVVGNRDLDDGDRVAAEPWTEAGTQPAANVADEESDSAETTAESSNEESDQSTSAGTSEGE